MAARVELSDGSSITASAYSAKGSSIAEGYLQQILSGDAEKRGKTKQKKAATILVVPTIIRLQTRKGYETRVVAHYVL